MSTPHNALIVPIILSGGSGARLWPLSRELYPKQFHKIGNSDLTMIQNTIKRYKGLPAVQPPIVVCNNEHRLMIAEQLLEIGIGDADILLEPVARNTAPAIAAAAHYASRKYQNEELPVLLLILSADHYIANEEKFCEAVMTALPGTVDGNFAVFGAPPSTPHTGYGYIKRGGNHGGSERVWEVEEFVEKPDAQTAQKYLDAKGYFWNCGIFLFNAQSLLNAIEIYCPNVGIHTKSAVNLAHKEYGFIALDEQSFANSPGISIDYALLENLPKDKQYGKKVLITPLETTWSDIGSWDAIYDLSDKDKNNNAHSGDVISEETSGNYIRGGNRLIATLGVKDLIIVDTDDSLLIAQKSGMHGIRNLVKNLSEKRRPEAINPPKTYNTWGTSKTLEQEEDFEINRVTVIPGQHMTMQSHQYHSKHWVILHGEATIIRNDETIQLQAGHSIEIPAGTAHRLSNLGTTQLEIIEVHCGDDNASVEKVARYGDSR